MDVLATNAQLESEIDVEAVTAAPRGAAVRGRCETTSTRRPRSREPRPGSCFAERTDRARAWPGRRAPAGTMRCMDRLFVTGGARLAGSVRISGAKNSALKLMAASLLAPGRSVLRNVPRIQDCFTMGEVLEHLGAGVVLGGRGRRRSTRRTCPRSRRRTSSSGGCAPRSPSSARCWRGPVRRAWRCRVATTSARARSTSTSTGSGGWARDIDAEHGFLVATTDGLDGRLDHARLPERGRHREPDDGRGRRPTGSA